MNIWTIGAYGTTRESFLDALCKEGVDILMDTRRRAGMRGATYAFFNKGRLSEGCRSCGIEYIHVRDLAPTKEIRAIQSEYDKKHKQGKYGRDELCEAFVHEYKRQILGDQTGREVFEKALSVCQNQRAESVALFCVERDPKSCHRSLLATYLADQLGVKVRGDLTP
ncbi:MAG: DUF488 domain-containing protein [Bacteroidota bacterium]|nr:DUF488 domain-containing protein [Bacteroidota bacterium]MXW15052.1 DUF488 domain-containing protein [Rhodothermaceae bacterium]MYC05022.1 DUF488 domain-containing protein [Rhodothermaceae bacterium]MYI17903.1 DUF488 domain-containing protein [Rhodothermaceae bacterium]